VTLAMPKPVKDKKSGIFYIRVRVPVGLVAAFGRAEIVKSLRTRDPSEAKAHFATGEQDIRWQMLSSRTWRSSCRAAALL
jgi:hypothetical protein